MAWPSNWEDGSTIGEQCMTGFDWFACACGPVEILHIPTIDHSGQARRVASPPTRMLGVRE
jgi:hypothetical protein